MDVKSALWNSDLLKELYLVKTPGFVVSGQEHKVLRLYKVYGPLWALNAKLDATLDALRFCRSDSKHNINARAQCLSHMLVEVYTQL